MLKTTDHESQLRSLGYRLTPQRQVILDTLRSIEGHITSRQIIDFVKQVNPAIDRTTIYRTLELFHDIGFVFSSSIAGETVYELASEIPHHHLVCRECGKVHVLSNHHFDTLIGHLLAEHNFHAEIAHITIPGVCAECFDAKHKTL